MSDVSNNSSAVAASMIKRAENVRKATIRSLHESGQLVRARAVLKAPVSAGQLRASITVTVDESALVAHVRVGAKHGIYVEKGTRAHFPPIDPILRWVMRTFGVDQREGKGIAFAVARKIAKHGTPARPFLTPAFEDSRADIRGIFTRNVTEALTRG